MVEFYINLAEYYMNNGKTKDEALAKVPKKYREIVRIAIDKK